jgi:hypothetical protein
MSLKKLFFLSSLTSCFVQTAFAREGLSNFVTPEITEETSPWFTGPLLAPSSHNIPNGHYDIEPYLFFTTTTGSYNQNWHHRSSDHNFYSLNFVFPGWIGLNSFMDFTIQPQMFYQFTQGQRSTQFGDLSFGFDIQLLSEEVGTWWPAVKIAFKATGPTGKYQNLDPKKLGTDGAGSGNWNPAVNLVFGRLFRVYDNHFLAPRLAFSYTVPTPTRVSNLNVYGGTEGTHGTAYPGNSFYTDFGVEYNMSHNWVFAMDVYYQHNNKNRFSGNTGITPFGIPAVVTSPSSESFSLAPAIEYNWSANIGLIGGVWFTVGGRNSSQFISGVLAFNLYI